MTRTTVNAGICGFESQVIARMDGDLCQVEIISDCASLQRLSAELKSVDPMQEISFRGETPQTLQKAAQFCMHAACPISAAIIKTIEVEAGLALPADVRIQIAKEPED